ncbi:hypothetical protein QBC37DRAFT_87775 [Rhypophila decipiens]|uniref:Uncharacterized protein n=1 Tax=Rhypophila decipiens TaxID=261697 RepID=A0AAN6YDH1_9PEZI|nr:hypothetical protein QBC37DRAFT_87775 [Rhypophila decipiens]
MKMGIFWWDGRKSKLHVSGASFFACTFTYVFVPWFKDLSSTRANRSSVLLPRSSWQLVLALLVSVMLRVGGGLSIHKHGGTCVFFERLSSIPSRLLTHSPGSSSGRDCSIDDIYRQQHIEMPTSLGSSRYAIPSPCPFVLPSSPFHRRPLWYNIQSIHWLFSVP